MGMGAKGVKAGGAVIAAGGAVRRPEARCHELIATGRRAELGRRRAELGHGREVASCAVQAYRR